MHEEAVDDDDDAADKAKVFLPGLATRCKQDDRGAVSGSKGQWGAVMGSEGPCIGSLGNWKVHGNNKYEIASVIKLTFVLPFSLQSVNK